MKKPIDECVCFRNICFIPSEHDPEKCPVALWSADDKRLQDACEYCGGSGEVRYVNNPEDAGQKGDCPFTHEKKG